MLPIRLGPIEIILILFILILFFGVGRISKIGKELGTAVRQFRKGWRSSEEEHKKEE